MITEGVGRKAPAPIVVSFTDHDLGCLKIETTKLATYRQYKAMAGTWEQGIRRAVVIQGVGKLTQDERPIFCGMMGECATMYVINKKFPDAAKMDFTLRRRGDFGVDLAPFGVKLQVKTRQTPKYGNLIRRVKKHGGIVQMPSHAFVFCQWDGSKSVRVLGWCIRREIEHREPVPAPFGDWKNIVVKDEELLPMCNLLDELDRQKELQAWR